VGDRVDRDLKLVRDVGVRIEVDLGIPLEDPAHRAPHAGLEVVGAEIAVLQALNHVPERIGKRLDRIRIERPGRRSVRPARKRHEQDEREDEPARDAHGRFGSKVRYKLNGSFPSCSRIGRNSG
jgi:hypothetical protein